MDSLGIYKRANSLVRQYQTRDPETIALNQGISIFPMKSKTLLGMYTYRWKHRMIFLKSDMNEFDRRMVVAHELGHDSEHRDIAKASKDGLREFVLFKLNNNTEYEANAFASHILLDDEEVLSYAHDGCGVVQISQIMGVNANLLLIKLQEMSRMGYDIRLTDTPDSRFLKKVGERGQYSEEGCV